MRYLEHGKTTKGYRGREEHTKNKRKMKNSFRLSPGKEERNGDDFPLSPRKRWCEKREMV